MKPKSIILLAVALGCGLVAMLGVQQALSSKDDKPREETAKVLVATTDIAPGIPLDDANTQFKTLPKAAVPEGAVTSAEEFKDRSLRVGAVPGEMIMLAKLGEPGVFGASSEIPEGLRVVTVPVDLTKTHSGLIRPGDRVDVLLSYSVRVPGQGPMSKVRTVLEYIKVFATDSLRAGASSKDEMEFKAKNISLLVDPEQAKLLMMAQSLGQLQLALRHKMDSAPAGGQAVSLEEFEDGWAATTGAQDPMEPEAPSVETALRQELQTQIIEPTAVVEPQKDTWTIHIYAGGEHRVEEVSEPSSATAI